jgi:alcohol dehydrogenase class IV
VSQQSVVFRPLEGIRAIVSGVGAVREHLGTQLDEQGVRRPMIVCGANVSASPVLTIAREAAGRPAAVFTGSRQHTPVDAVDAGLDAALAHRADGLIAVGGSSAVDCAKAIAVLLRSGRSAMSELPPRGYARLGDTDEVGHPDPMPVVCVPTTLSMAEFNPFFGVRDPQTATKLPYGDAGLVRRTILLDGEVAAHTPADLWAQTGLKAFDDAVWRYCCAVRAEPAADAVLEHSTADLLRLLPRSVATADPEPRQRVFAAAWLTAFPVPRAHPTVRRRWFSMAARHTLGGLIELPHGIGSCVSLRCGLRLHLEDTAQRQQRLAATLGSLDPEAAGLSLDRIVGRLLDALAVPTTLTQLGVPEATLDAVLHGILEEAPELGSPQRLREVCTQMWRPAQEAGR